LWFIVVPVSGTAAATCLQKLSRGGPMDRGVEAAALFASAFMVGLLAQLALRRASEPFEAMTLRETLLGAMTLAAAAASPLAAVPWNVRRTVISGVIVLHFAGIASAALSPPPSPFIVQQLWTRIFRPYLEFMYLNNAYHFYAPDPGPASYLWF